MAVEEGVGWILKFIRWETIKISFLSFAILLHLLQSKDPPVPFFCSNTPTNAALSLIIPQCARTRNKYNNNFATTIYTTNTTQIANPLPHSMDDTLQLQNHNSTECAGRSAGGWFPQKGRGRRNREKKVCGYVTTTTTTNRTVQKNIESSGAVIICILNSFRPFSHQIRIHHPLPLKPSFIAATTPTPSSPPSTIWTQMKVYQHTSARTSRRH